MKELGWSQWYHLVSSLRDAIACSRRCWLKAPKLVKRDISLCWTVFTENIFQRVTVSVRQVILFLTPEFNLQVLNLHLSCSECIWNIFLVVNIVGLLFLSFQSVLKYSFCFVTAVRALEL